MAAKKTTPPGWEVAFLAARRAGQSVGRAAALAGVSAGTAYYYRDRNPVFAAEWLATSDAPGGAREIDAAEAPDGRFTSRNWKAPFLEALVETSSIRVSAARAGASLAKVYKARREDVAFASKWREALLEGYDNLEMDLLGYLRDPQPGRKMDVAAALRLLVAHRETVARERALREDDDEQAVLDSIDKFIDEMRDRRAANSAILLEAAPGDGED